MKYVDDIAVDKIVAEDRALRDVVQGRRVMLWGPGYGAWVGAQACMSFGSICAIIAAAFLAPPGVEHFWKTMVFGVLPTGAVLVGTSQTVLRGFAFGRRVMYRFTQLLSVVSIGVVLACLQFGDNARGPFSLGLSVAAGMLCIASMFIVAGPGYALASAFFRARRVHGLRESAVARELSSTSPKR